MVRTHFDHDLDALEATISSMAEHVDKMLGDAMLALQNRDCDLAAQILRSDDVVDALNVQIESRCMELIALQQPVGRDLRLISVVLNSVTDIERIGDHSVDIAKIARKLSAADRDMTAELLHMSDLAHAMLQDTIRALAAHDAELAKSVITSDDAVDDALAVFENRLHEAMAQKVVRNVDASYLLFVGHHIERIADHVVNVAERLAHP
ncbi:MAG: phosphate signaling complex protein PhoU [Capsulimonadaceae bacterium]